MSPPISIRQLTPDDWPLCRSLRLEALTKHPSFFSPSRDESQFSENEWRERLASPQSATFALFSGEEAIGLTGVVRMGGDPNSSRAELVASYIREAFRGGGLWERLFVARVEWARRQKTIRTLEIRHRDDNLAVRRAVLKHGFRLVESRDRLWPDGQTRPCLIYEMEIGGLDHGPAKH